MENKTSISKQIKSISDLYKYKENYLESGYKLIVESIKEHTHKGNYNMCIELVTNEVSLENINNFIKRLIEDGFKFADNNIYDSITYINILILLGLKIK